MGTAATWVTKKKKEERQFKVIRVSSKKGNRKQWGREGRVRGEWSWQGKK